MTDAGKTGALIAALRKKKGLTQAQLAAQLGVTNKAVSKWETGAGIPDLSVLPALCGVLGVTADALLRGILPCGQALSQDASQGQTQTDRLQVQQALPQEPLAQGSAQAPAGVGASASALFYLPFSYSIPSLVCLLEVHRRMHPQRKRWNAVSVVCVAFLYTMSLGIVVSRGNGSWAAGIFGLCATLLLIDTLCCGYAVAAVAFLLRRWQPVPTLCFFEKDCRVQRADSLTTYDYKALRTLFCYKACLVWDFDGKPVATQRPDADTLEAIFAHLQTRVPPREAAQMADVEANQAPEATAKNKQPNTHKISVLNEPLTKRKALGVVAACVCVLLFATVSVLRLQGVYASLSPQGKCAVVRVNPATGNAAWFRFFGKQGGTFAYAVTPDSPLKFQWLTRDACAVTYVAKADKMAHQSVITYGDRGNGAYDEMAASLQGLWATNDKTNTLYYNSNMFVLKYLGRMYLYETSGCVPFGTIAAVLCYEDVPQFTVVLGEDYVRAENRSPAGGSIVICPVSMDYTVPVTIPYQEISS